MASSTPATTPVPNTPGYEAGWGMTQLNALKAAAEGTS